MKQLKKLTGILLALAMIMTLCVTAFAEGEAEPTATPDPTAAVAGETYNAYKIFDATISGEAAAYSITLDNPFYQAVVDSKMFTLALSADGTKYVVEKNGSFNAAKLAEKLAAVESKGDSTSAKADSDGEVSINVNSDGYYLVTSSLGAVCQLTTAGTLTVQEKNTIPDVDKKVGDNSAYAAIGDKIPYTITITDGTGTNKEIKLHDTMTTGLTFNNDISIKVNETEVAEGSYTLTTTGLNDGCTFEIVFSADYVASLEKDAKIMIAYSATVNKDAVDVDEMTNTASIDYSNQTTTDTSVVKTETNSFSVVKYAEGNNDKTPIAGAVFQLKDTNGNVVKLIKNTNTNTEYFVADATQKNSSGAVDSFTTVADTAITIKGVDSDVTYTLVETVAPNGYNLLTKPVTVKVNADNSTVSEIANSAGSTLPTTGGMGTTLIYVVGAALAVGAGVVLITRRRMNADQ